MCKLYKYKESESHLQSHFYSIFYKIFFPMEFFCIYLFQWPMVKFQAIIEAMIILSWLLKWILLNPGLDLLVEELRKTTKLNPNLNQRKATFLLTKIQALVYMEGWLSNRVQEEGCFLIIVIRWCILYKRKCFL